MAEIKDCIGKNVRISKCSITIKSDDGKTCGVVRDIRKFKDIQPNKTLDYFHILRKCGAWGNKNFSVDNCIEKDGNFTEEEKNNAEEQENIYNALKVTGIDVIECLFI